MAVVSSRRSISRGSAAWNLACVLGALALLVFLQWAGTAVALDQPISGKKLLLKGGQKFVLISKDAGIDISGADPECQSGGSSLVFSDGVNSTTFLLPCANWDTNGSGTLKYGNASAPEGPSTVKIVRLKNGLLKVIGKGPTGMPIPNGAATINVVLNLDGITHRFCLGFSGAGDGSRFTAKNAAVGSCPTTPPCAATTGGFCWFLGSSNESCDQVCALSGRAYDAATSSYTGSDGTEANCTAVLDALGVPAGALFTSSTCFDGIGCIYAPPEGRARCVAPPTNSFSAGGVQRVCACQ